MKLHRILAAAAVIGTGLVAVPQVANATQDYPPVIIEPSGTSTVPATTVAPTTEAPATTVAATTTAVGNNAAAPTTAAPALPATGNGNSSTVVMLAALMFGLGIAALAATRRRQLS